MKGKHVALALGVAAGAALAFLAVSKKGKETRQIIGKKTNELFRNFVSKAKRMDDSEHNYV